MSDRTKCHDSKKINETIFELARFSTAICDLMFNTRSSRLFYTDILVTKLKSEFERKIDEFAEGTNQSREEIIRQIRHANSIIQPEKQVMDQKNQRIYDEQRRMINSLQEVSISVCSDAHLGRQDSRKDYFYSWLKSHGPDQTVVLLGDILDFWIYSQNDNQEDLITRIVGEWNRLWDELNILRQKNTKIYYVPGNHDAFVFFIEAADQFSWAKAIMDRSVDFQRVRDRTNGKRFSSVVDIVYPFLKLELPIDNKKILFTHGHYVRWWRLITGIQELTEIRDSILFLTTVSIVFAHRHARKFRQLMNNRDWLMRVKGIEDTAILITNAIVRTHEQARNNLAKNPEVTLNIIDQALELHFCGKAAITEEEELRIRDCLLALSQLQGHNVPCGMQDIWNVTMDFLKNTCEESVHLDCSGGQEPLHRTPFRDFQDFNYLVFGHHHQPRDQEPIYDVGGFVDNCCTSLAIHKDGSVTRPI